MTPTAEDSGSHIGSETETLESMEIDGNDEEEGTDEDGGGSS
jgi:hypothetical protein